ncbi:flavin reductase family protein [Streptomyces sp. L2]|uniref:flavin reductase family protein n=1 Tax=Streptomyces sp. L2 TaxID=2162665 RepID=UPI001011A63F|nr:flavin reductase family protein [Streptomyces sp. L2]
MARPPVPDGATADQPADIRPLMARFPTGVSVVTALTPDGEPRGMTCNSLTSVALSPATLMVCLRAAGPTLGAVLRSGHFAVNLLHEEARATAQLFASCGANRFSEVEWRLPVGAHGPHLATEALAIADCRVRHTIHIGDHVAVFAEVDRTVVHEDAEPLLYGRRRYARWSDATTASACAPLAESATRVVL